MATANLQETHGEEGFSERLRTLEEKEILSLRGKVKSLVSDLSKIPESWDEAWCRSMHKAFEGIISEFQLKILNPFQGLGNLDSPLEVSQELLLARNNFYSIFPLLKFTEKYLSEFCGQDFHDEEWSRIEGNIPEGWKGLQTTIQLLANQLERIEGLD